MTRFARRFREVARTLRSVELTRHSMADAFDAALLDIAPTTAGSRRFLDFYGDEGILVALDRYGILDALRRRGYDHFRLEIDPDEHRHTLLVHARHIGGQDHVRLVELVVRRDTLVPGPGAPEENERAPYEPVEVLTIDWLCLQNPVAAFTERRPRLPGQTAPGLGIGEQVLELLHRVVVRLRLGGLLTVAEYFHNAVLYARELPYVDPESMGELEALSRLLLEEQGLSLTQATWAVEWGLVSCNGEPFTWRGEAQVGARDRALRAWLESRRYERLAAQAAIDTQFDLDTGAFRERWADELPDLLQPP
ncbi:MAG: hypothetical protein EA398_01080 [Deltaproteobacteria bacterium]|nr:MAG: hypothetical protein EA398_01080 [Deltaproteobacteria bacterium]